MRESRVSVIAATTPYPLDSMFLSRREVSSKPFNATADVIRSNSDLRNENTVTPAQVVARVKSLVGDNTFDRICAIASDNLQCKSAYAALYGVNVTGGRTASSFVQLFSCISQIVFNRFKHPDQAQIHDAACSDKLAVFNGLLLSQSLFSGTS
jgi:hypothetical protein